MPDRPFITKSIMSLQQSSRRCLPSHKRWDRWRCCPSVGLLAVWHPCAHDPAGSSSAALTPSHNVSVCAVDLWVRCGLLSRDLPLCISAVILKLWLAHGGQTHEFALDTVNTAMALHGGQCPSAVAQKPSAIAQRGVDDW